MKNCTTANLKRSKNNLPEFLVKKLIEQYGENLTEKILEGYSLKRSLTIRVNTIKTNVDTIENILTQEKIPFRKVDWYKEALIIEGDYKAQIQSLSMYKNGEIYMQSLSSMLPPLILSPKAHENILDMAAAPGGKTTQMVALSKQEAMITACEKNKIRAERLQYNLEKQGAMRVNVMQEDARNLSTYFSFDKILLDAPCSGSGTIYLEHTKQIENFDEELISRSTKTQKALLKKALQILKPGGEMLYSTCSILNEENENVLEEVLKSENTQIVPIDPFWKEEIPMLPVRIKGTICVCPTKVYEGFFMAKIQKNR